MTLVLLLIVVWSASLRAQSRGEGISVLESAVSQTPSDWRAWTTLGIASTSAGNLERAGQALGRACELAPDDEEACYFFVRNLHFTGQYEAARDPFEKALRAARKQMLARIHRAIALNFSALSMPAEAEFHFRKAIQSAALAAPGGEDPKVDFG